MVQKPVIAGSVYMTDGVARIKMSLSYGGEPLVSQTPTVTIVRDRDNYVLDFTTDTFVETTGPSDLGQSKFKHQMEELGLGSYYWDFDPVLYNAYEEEVYTVIFVNDHPIYGAATQDEFLMTNRFDFPRFGMLDRPKDICLNEETTFAYQAKPGQTDVLLSIYDQYNNLQVANATMTEIDNSGIYKYKHIFTLDGEYVIVVSENTNKSTDSMLVTVGKGCDRLKRIEQMLSDLIQNPPTVGPC